MPLCSHCGQENPDGFRFCGRCGAALAEAAPAREVRKTVTLLFCDVSDELELLSERAYRSTCAACLADALYATGRSDEAEEIAYTTEAESSPEDPINFAVVNGVLAPIAADRGDTETARARADQAID